MTNTPSLPPGGEKQADQVEAVARAILKEAPHLAGRSIMKDDGVYRWPTFDELWPDRREYILEIAHAALSASKPLVVEECAKVADGYLDSAGRLLTGDYRQGAQHASIGISGAIRALRESPSEGRGG